MQMQSDGRVPPAYTSSVLVCLRCSSTYFEARKRGGGCYRMLLLWQLQQPPRKHPWGPNNGNKIVVWAK